MPTITEDLIMRVLLCFLKSAPEDCTVTGISRTLKEEKYKISRAVIELEKEGLVDRSDQRHPILTETGRKQAGEAGGSDHDRACENGIRRGTEHSKRRRQAVCHSGITAMLKNLRRYAGRMKRYDRRSHRLRGGISYV